MSTAPAAMAATAMRTRAADAALLSRAMGGAAVRVQWMRADEHVWDPKGAADPAGHGGGPRWRRRPRGLAQRAVRPRHGGKHRPPAAGELAGTASTRRHRAEHRDRQPRCALCAFAAVHTQAAPGSRRRRSARPGSGPRGGCRTPSRMRAFSTNARPRPAAGIRWPSRLKLLADRGRSRLLQRLAEAERLAAAALAAGPVRRRPARPRAWPMSAMTWRAAHVGAVAEVEVTPQHRRHPVRPPLRRAGLPGRSSTRTASATRSRATWCRPSAER